MSIWNHPESRLPYIESFYLEYQSSGLGVNHLNSNLKAAIVAAQSMCLSDTTVVNVYDGQDIKIAEVTRAGANYKVFPRRLGSFSPRD